MKIVCDNCATKYSIADEKVRGKVFKIRCKKCSHIIVVRGSADGVAEAQKEPQAEGGFPGDDAQTLAARGGTPAAGVPSGEAVWHLVVDREQVGPLSAGDVRAKFAAGQIDAETFAWREGFGDWLRLASIDEFRDLGGAAPAARDSADLFAAAPSESAPLSADGDVFGGAPANNAYAAPASSESDAFAGGGLFSAPSAPAEPLGRPRGARTSSPGLAAVSAADPGMGPPAVDVKPMTGQRNESSVLFSLNNLQALASGSGGAKSAPAAALASAPAPESRPGFASSSSEGSGLIDIRAMAASTLGDSPSSAASSSGRLDDLPAMSAAPVFTPMAAPILMPAASSGPPKWIWAVLGTGVFALVGIVVLGVMLWTRKPEPAVAPVAAVAPAATAPAPAAAAPGTPAPPTAATLSPQAAAAAAAEEKKVVRAKAPKSSSPKVAKSDPLVGAASGKAEAAAPPPAAPHPAEKKKSSKPDALDDLLNEGAPDKPAKRAVARDDEAASSGGGDEALPEQLDKSAIMSGMGKVSGRVRGCFDQFKVPGVANVAMVIATSGRVSSANVTGPFAGTPTGDCVGKAVKGASFPRHKGAPQSIVYPYVFK